MNHRRQIVLSADSIHSAYAYVQVFCNSQVPKSRAAKFYAVPRNIRESSVWDLFHITLLTPRIMRLHKDFYKICVPLC
jgi:hypothetical protein